MKKIVLMSLLLLCGWISAGAVDLNKENRDPKYVESIVNRSQKIVDKLGLTDVKAAEDVCNIIANRYFELNDIYEIRDAKEKTVKESGLTGDAKNEALKAAKNEKDVAEISNEIKSGIEICYVESMDEVIELSFAKKIRTTGTRKSKEKA